MPERLECEVQKERYINILNVYLPIFSTVPSAWKYNTVIITDV